jgi:TRAP-type C4-dicarboxylate transport system substrate-binding protein
MGDPYGRRMTRIALISLLVVALLAGCDSGSSDRAGGEKPVKAKVLVMANAQYQPDELEAFDEAVGRVSGGRLRLKWLNEYGSGRDGNAEINLIRDVSAGKADLGWAATRIFDELGVPAFNPLHAPMLIDSYELEEEVLTDDVVDPMLESLGELGLRGIGVLPGPLRRPFGKHPLRGLDDWEGARIGSSGGVQVDAALRSIGAKRELEYAGGDTGGIDGLDTHIAAVPPNRYHRDVPYLTGNVVLWARPLVLFAGPNVSSEDLAVLRRAAQTAIPEALALSRSMESEGLSETCRSTLKVVTATAGEVDALRSAFRPVYDRLERDESASRAVARIDELAREGGGGVDPVRCPQASKAEAGTIPPGTYRTVLTRADAQEHGIRWGQVVEVDPDPRALKSKTREVRIEFTEQGAFLLSNVLLDGTPEVEWEGTYSIYRDRISVQGTDGVEITARVEIDGARLRFTDVQPGPKTPEAMTWGSKPFVKID